MHATTRSERTAQGLKEMRGEKLQIVILDYIQKLRSAHIKKKLRSS